MFTACCRYDGLCVGVHGVWRMAKSYGVRRMAHYKEAGKIMGGCAGAKKREAMTYVAFALVGPLNTFLRKR